ncbi:Cohesin subunit rad21 [Smittium culicis]|uniref:Cohesin subunit rad21 n=1 Tax=Smittium culicis TaxID=133412 RepID=A0A1R1YD11_9FUNG|nr:Cohesin subunit rad21 [Smittium culicis]
MFYSDAVLLQNGPLSKVWLAANWERKMNKAQFIQASIVNSVGAMISSNQPPLALRLSGQLLLGVSKIYSKKAKYLMEDCSEALLKIKMAFRSGVVDILEATIAQRNAITLPDTISEFEMQLPTKLFSSYSFMLENDSVLGDASSHLAGQSSIFDNRARDRFANHMSALHDITLPEESMIARHNINDQNYADQLLGRDDEFRLDLGDDWLNNNDNRIRIGDDSAMDIEVARRESNIPFNEPSIFDSVSRFEMGDKSILAGPNSFIGEGLGMDGISMAADVSAIAGSSNIGDASGILGAGEGLRFEDRLNQIGGSNLDDFAWEQAEAEVLDPNMANATDPNADAATKKRKRFAGVDLFDDITNYPLSKLKQNYKDPTSMLSIPKYLDSNSAPTSNSGTAAISFVNKIFDFPTEIKGLFATTLMNPTDYLITNLNDTRFSIDASLESNQVAPDSSNLHLEGAFEFGLDNDLNLSLDNDNFAFGDPDSFANLDPAAAGDFANASNSYFMNYGIVQTPNGPKRITTADISFGNTDFDLQLKSIMDSTDTSMITSTDRVPLFKGTEVDPSNGNALYDENADIISRSANSRLSLDQQSLSKSTHDAIGILSAQIAQPKSKKASKKPISFNATVETAPKSDVVKLFFEVLVLKTKNYIDVQQQDTNDISITPLDKFFQL